MAEDNRFKVYRLTNHSRGEVYIGVARYLGLREAQHAGALPGGAKTIAHWNWLTDDIRRYTYSPRFNSRQRASDFAHAMEVSAGIPQGYVVFLTPGT